jgi:hypothetical protein
VYLQRLTQFVFSTSTMILLTFLFLPTAISATLLSSSNLLFGIYFLQLHENSVRSQSTLSCFIIIFLTFKKFLSIFLTSSKSQ